MTNTYFLGDTHFGHSNIITFTCNDGQRIRPFKDILEHDETLIKNINEDVKPEDRLYFMGDVVMNRKFMHIISRINGRKKLIKGNHDIFKLVDYTPYFEDIVSYRIYPDSGIVFSHIPLHPCQLERRFKYNVHGHLHSNVVPLLGHHSTELSTKIPDTRYLNICPEHTNFRAVSYDEILTRLNISKREI